MNFKPEDFDPAHEYAVKFNGVEVPIEIETEEIGPSPLQLEALAQALALSPDALEAAAPAVVKNYELYRGIMQELGDPEIEMPPLEHPMDVWKLIEPTDIQIPLHSEGTPPSFLLMAECDWEPEHGLAVRFRNGIADAAGQQGDGDLFINN